MATWSRPPGNRTFGSAGAWSLSAGQRSQPLVVDAVYERVRMAMHELPLRIRCAPKHPGHAERPVLLRQITDGAALPLDDGKHRQVTGRVRRNDFDCCVAAAKELRESRPRLVRVVEAYGRITA